MTDSARSRGIIALFAAYVMALQALLLPLSAAAGPLASSGLCQSASSIGDSAPAGHQNGCPGAAGCCVQCCAQTSLLPPPQVVAAIAFTRVGAATSARFVAPLPQPHELGPYVPRGPPFT
ncbi:MAG TPA: DUF2946 family protein [Pseudolabrys sp.]|nr:DUF2946 family protein [Pseudolabrys sp.]